MQDVCIPCRPRKLLGLAATLFFGLCAVILGLGAAHNTKPLVHKWLILPTQQATQAYWVLAAASVLIALLGLYLLVQGFISKKQIIFAATTLTAPKNGLSGGDVTVAYADIDGFHTETVHNTRVLHISHRSGTLAIPGAMLPGKKAFDELVAQLQARVSAHR